MIKKFNDYESTKGYTGYAQLPKGAYVLIIKDAVVKSNSNGDYIQISCDVAEGEYKDFFLTDYKSQQSEDKKWHCNYLLNIPKDDGSERDGWTKRSFKTFTEALEDSNEGYHFDWDEAKFKGKLIGGLFNVRQYKGNDGTVRESTNLKRVCAVEMIRSEKYRLPKDDLLKTEDSHVPGEESAFMDLSSVQESEVPFN